MGKAIDLTGSKIGMLKLLKRKREDKRTYYYCRCDCGTKKWIRADCIGIGKTESCGCFGEKNIFKPKDITGKISGRLKAIRPTEKRDKDNGSVIWECICECGNTAYVAEYNLSNKSIRSCGCLGKETYTNNMQKATKKHLEEHIVEGTNILEISRKEPKSNNTSGVIGVMWDRSRNKWKAVITFKKKVYQLGRYTRKEDAILVRKQAEEKLFGEFLDWYKKRFNNHEDTNNVISEV